MKAVYFVYPGLGKTTLAKKNAKIVDIQIRLFKDAQLAKYIGTTDYPNYRGNSIVKINPEFPNNLCKYALQEIGNGKILLFVPKTDGYNLMNALNITDYAFIMPDKERLEQLKQDYIARGDNSDYINRNLNERYKSVLDYANQMKKEIIFLKPGEYLSDIFI